MLDDSFACVLEARLGNVNVNVFESLGFILPKCTSLM